MSRPTVDDNVRSSNSGDTSWTAPVRRVTFAVTLAAGATALFLALDGLRAAHLYRQRTGEGLQFVGVGLWLVVAHGLLGTAAFAVTRPGSGAARAPQRRTRLVFAALIVAGLVVAGLVVADVFVLWVEAHGDRRIGPCR